MYTWQQNNAAGDHAHVCVAMDSRFHTLRARPAGWVMQRQGPGDGDAHPACSLSTHHGDSDMVALHTSKYSASLGPGYRG